MAKIRKKIPDISSISSDMITIYNRNKMVLEGVERIIFCDSEKMILRKRGLVKIEGKGLHLKELGNDNIAVSGKLLSLEFCEGEA